MKKLLPFILFAVFVIIIWPWSKSRGPQEEVVENSRKKIKQVGIAKERTKKDFKPQRVSANLKQEEIRQQTETIENPDAVQYNEQSEIAISQGPGTTPAITAEEIAEKPQIRSAIEATKNPEKFASRLSPMFKASKFDKQKFLNDPEYRKFYVENPEPARVWQEDQASEYKLERVSDYYQESWQNEEVTIEVKGAPSLPISIHSTDLGKFLESGLTYATVIADKSGIARFTFVAPEGTFGDTNILVGGVGSRGNLRFKIHTKIKPQGK